MERSARNGGLKGLEDLWACVPPTGFVRHNSGGRAHMGMPEVPPTGFEPVISALRGQRPKPLDDEGTPGNRGICAARPYYN